MSDIAICNVVVKVEDIIDYAKYHKDNRIRFVLESKFEHDGEVRRDVPMYVDYSDQGVDITCLFDGEEIPVSVAAEDFVKIEQIIDKAYKTLGLGTYDFKEYREIADARKGCLGDYLLDDKLWNKLIEFTMESKYVPVKSKELFGRVLKARDKGAKSNGKMLVFSLYTDEKNEKHLDCRVYNRAMLQMREKSCWPVDDINDISFDDISEEELQTIIADKDFLVPYLTLESISFEEVVNADIDIGNVFANNPLVVIAMIGAKLGFCGEGFRDEKLGGGNNTVNVERTLSALKEVNNIINTRF